MITNKYYEDKLLLDSIGHFRFLFRLVFKASPHAKLFLVNYCILVLVAYDLELIFIRNSMHIASL